MIAEIEAPLVECAYCEKPLTCDICRAIQVPPTQEHYESLSQPDVPQTCYECGAALVCHWCKTPYDGFAENDSGAVDPDCNESVD